MSRGARGALVAVGVVLAAVVAGCGANPVSLSLRSGTVSVCYRGLPIAKAALHDEHAKLRGVHRLPVDTLEKRFPTATLPTGDDDTEACAFSFAGTFRPGQVALAPPGAHGSSAVVLVSSKQLHLIASYVGDKLPDELSAGLAREAGVSR